MRYRYLRAAVPEQQNRYRRRVFKVFKAWAIGIGIDIGLLILQNAGIAPRVLQRVSLPGLFLASVLRFGSHDFAALLVTILTDGIEFGAIILVLDFLFFHKSPAES